MLGTAIRQQTFPLEAHLEEFLDPEEVANIVAAVGSVFRKLINLQKRVAPIYEEYGFRLQSAGVAARDLSEKIEVAIVQHCRDFTKGHGHADLARHNEDWEVKVCQSSGLTINQCKVVNGEHYIVVNYDGETSKTKRIWVLWHAHDNDFSPRRSNSNARAMSWKRAQLSGRAQVLYEISR
jgi:hypothetical protein